MRIARLVIAASIMGCAASAAQAATVVVYVEPMTLERYTKVIDTKGPDRLFMCMAPPSTSGCTEVRIRRR
jgi:carbamoylphosphate synthase large subunit